ncbi:KICSTOR complex protein SZT2-like [Ornithodoros turicata]|uniref:KICSTOR complex protein SZT2-like n=1 Tax=Ornithodoros turicata TaxID=34597 RepID=UPI00313A1D09
MESSDTEERLPVLEADDVYVQMKKQYRVSRYIRAQWFVNHLGKTIQPKQNEEFEEEIEVLSVLPKNCSASWSPATSHQFSYLVTSATKVTFLAKKYRFVFCLDLSASIATVDIQNETLLFDEVFPALEQCIESMVMPFQVPGSCISFQPELYITVIACVPHYTPAVQQVLIQGWPLTRYNKQLFLKHVADGLLDISEVLAKATAGVAELHEHIKLQSEKLTGGLFEELEEQAALSAHVNMTPSDMSTLNMLKYGMLALQLLPENSSAGIVVITDGMISLPNSIQLESLLTSLRTSTVACSFFQLGSRYHAKNCLGFVPYDDIMRFIARATFGAFLDSVLHLDDSAEPGNVNVFHKALLFWSFQEESINRRLSLSKDLGPYLDFALAESGNLEQCQNIQPLRKKNSDGTLSTSLWSILSCKLREGYALRNISAAKGEIEVRLVLPWKFDVDVEYVVTVPWPSQSRRESLDSSPLQQRPICSYEVYVEASYEFLHDVTCEYFKPNKPRSICRITVAQQYWNALKNISSTDQFLVHLHSFNQNPAYYTVPDSIRNGVPLFVIPHNGTHPVLSSKSNCAYAQFATFWKLIAVLDMNIWQRWMHVHRVGLLLEHDVPLPRHLQQANSSGRYDTVQCRQVLNRLAALLRDTTSFVLVENHCYVGFLQGDGDKPPVSFYVIRVTYKAPCMVIRFAFLGGTPGEQRNAIVKSLTDEILGLEFSRRASKGAVSGENGDAVVHGQRPYKKVHCCIQFRKPLERILIRHERVPRDIMSPAAVIPPHDNLVASMGGSRKAGHGAGNPQGAVDPTSQLSRYLHHRRWVWTIQQCPNVPLPLHAVTRVLKTLTKIRLEEGFHFAHSSSGILNLALEIQMKNAMLCDAVNVTLPCVVQYILFPPHSNTTIRESVSDDEDNEMETAEADGELQLVTECWVEPQCGVVVDCPLPTTYLAEKNYRDIPQALYEMDFECIASLITLEHLNLACVKGELACPGPITPQPLVTPPTTPALDSLGQPTGLRSTPDLTLSQAGLFQVKPTTPEPVVIPVPFSFSIMKLLPKCQQAEALFSTFSLSTHGKISRENIAAVQSRSNDLLLQHFLEAMQHLHDRELPLSREEMAMLPLEIYNRPRDVRLHPLPFSSPLTPSSPPEWRCFVRSFSGADASGHPATNSHVLLTFMPSSYHELLQLMVEGSEDREGDLLDAQRNNSLSSCVDGGSVQLCSTPLLEDGVAFHIPAMQRVEETIKDGENVGDADAEEEQSKSEGEAVSTVKQCIPLPVYIYDAPVSAVIGRLVYQGGVRRWKDVYLDLTMAPEVLPGSDQACQQNQTSEDAVSHKTLSPEPRSDDSEFSSDCIMVKKHCPLICKAFSRSFVYSVFRALQEGLTVDCRDVNAVVEDMCEESVVTIDITEFLQATCGHTRDFRIKTTVEHSHRALQEHAEQSAHGDDKEGPSLTDESLSSLFPVSLLERHHPCEVVQQLHLSIKQRFQEVLQEVFQPVPSRPDYYYYSPPHKEERELPAKENKEPVANPEGELSDWNDMDTDTDKSQNVEFCADAHRAEEPIAAADGAEKRALPDITSLGSRATGAESSAASARSVMGDTEEGDEDEAMETIREAEPFIPPLFGHLTCLIKTAGAVGTCSLTSLPTCLGEVINCLENSQPMLDLENMKVQLDLLCLTLPPDFEMLLTSGLVRSSTYRSDSSVNLDEHSEDDSHSIASSGFQVETSRDPLSHLPEFQNQVISKCVEKVKWMLRDEVSSAALRNYPLTAAMLRMVTDHVESTSNARSTTRLHAATGAPGCQVERVSLQFVFGPEQSFDKFLQEFKHLSLPSYRLEQADDEFYYVVLDTEASKVRRRQFGSLIPPLGVCSKDLIIPLEPHRHDNTTLEEETSPIRKLSLPEGMRPPSKLSDEDESEGGSGRRQEAFRTRRKQMGRLSRSKVGASLEERASSVPPGGQDEAPATEVPRKPGQSCPAELLDLKRSLQERQQATHLDNVETCAASTETIVHAEDGDDNALPISPLELTDMFRERVNSIASSCHGGEVSQVLQNVAPTVKSSGSSSRPQDSTRSTPNVFSEPDVGGQVSNTEDGYEGDSSESDSDLDWMNALDTKRPHLPPFWLILSPYPGHVDIFFHIREQPEDSTDLRHGLAVFEDVSKMINSICKVVNQMLLLQHLNESRMCNRLLVPEATEDIWSQDTGLDAMNSFQLGYDADLMDNQGDYLEATRKFKPGAFDCSVVWSSHFSLHPRLNTGTGRTGVSRGLQALRAVLTGFSVNNRKNMFVYQESPGSVFYLRLHEVQCNGRHGHEDDASFSAGSRSSSVLSLAQTQRKTMSEPEEDFDFRPRLSSGHSDRDQSHDTISIVSHTSGNRGRQCVVMHVHGITQPGFAIKGDLVSVMQNKLDDAVLEVLTTTLGRNPACNLTLDDVQFVQKPHKEPTAQLFCTVHSQLLPYLQAIMEYLRQNLRTYLHIPKYTDPRPECHFKPYMSQINHPPCHRDDDVFLFNRFKAMGTPSNGIACIIVSVVDGNGRLVQQLSCPKPTFNTHVGNAAPSEYKDVTFNSSYEVKSGTRSPPGPIAMIRFQIWCVGKDYLDQLEKKLENSVRHAFWDVLMEYHLLTCPVTCEADDEPASFSEPPTPVKVRRSGRVLAEKMREKPFLMSMFTPRSKEMSSSVPDMMEKLKSPRENSTEFDFSDALFSDASQFPPLVARSGGSSLDAESGDVHESKKLNGTFHHAMRPFFDGAASVGVPSVVVHKCCIKARRAIPLMLKELQLGLRNLAPHITLSMFIERTQKSRTEFLLFNPLEKQYMFPERYDDDVPGTQRRYIVIGRNLIQWKAFVGLSDLSSFLDAARGAKSHKSMQLFESQLLSTSSMHLDRPVEHCISLSTRTPGTPISGPPSGMASPSGEPLKLSEQDLTSPVFVPRQQLLFLVVEDKHLTLYLYNWTSEMSGGLFRLVTQLAEWHNLRRDFLYSAAYQKLGLFFNQPIARSIKDGSAESRSAATRLQVPTLGGGAPVLSAATSPAAATNPSVLLEHIINRHHPPSRNQDTVLSCATQSALSAQVAHVLCNTRPRCPMHKSGYADQDDPVVRHGKQILEVRGLKRKDLIEFNRIYDDKGTCANLLNMEKMLTLVRREARLVHFCQTPLLFNPTWRIRVAQVRDHTLDPHGTFFEGCPIEHNPNQRARHSSGGSQKSSGDGSRMRRASGAPSMSGQSSPKHRRSANEETWHMTVCSHYIQEYIQYLQNLGFVAIQTKHASSRKSSMVSMRRASRDADVGTAFPKKVVGGSALAGAELPRHCLFQWHLGGLYFFEVGFCDPYVFCNLYTVERPRLLSSGTSFYMSQITSEFIEDMDKIRVNMHMHSFTYDYHLRTIHSYVSGQQLLFKHGYHLTSFLDDFVKYYQKSPNYARNLIYSGSVSIPTNTVDPNQLYNYIIGHNKAYAMKVIRMVPVVCDTDADVDTEYALVEISSKKVSYRDANDVQQTDNFFVGILTIQDASPAHIDRKILCLNYYILLTSQRELFPKFTSVGPQVAACSTDGTQDDANGCFRPVRLPGVSWSQPTSRAPSRRSSAVSSHPIERVKSSQQITTTEETNIGVSGASSSSSLHGTGSGTRSRRGSFRGICEEEVAYLGYYSNHETLMQKVMSEQSSTVVEHLQHVVRRASLHCRRDYLWKCLTVRSKSSDDASQGLRESAARLPPISFLEFTELLGFVETSRLDETDPQLTPFLTMHFAWYQGLRKVLASHYNESISVFHSPDGSVQHVVVTSAGCPDSLILLTTNTQTYRADLQIVHREKSPPERTGSEKPHPRLCTLHPLIEEFINACCFHLWAGLLA